MYDLIKNRNKSLKTKFLIYKTLLKDVNTIALGRVINQI